MSPKKTAACRQRVTEHQSPRAELLLKQPTDQAILKSIQESCERQELLLNTALEELSSQRTQMNELALKVTALQQAGMEEAIQATISTNQPKLDKGTAETTSDMIETMKNGKQITKNISIKQKGIFWVRYTLVVEQERKSVSYYALLLCLGQCDRVGTSNNFLRQARYGFAISDTQLMLILSLSHTDCEQLKLTYGLTLESVQPFDLAKQGLKYWQLKGAKKLLYEGFHITDNSWDVFSATVGSSRWEVV